MGHFGWGVAVGSFGLCYGPFWLYDRPFWTTQWAVLDNFLGIKFFGLFWSGPFWRWPFLYSPEMTYNVSSGTLNPTIRTCIHTIHSLTACSAPHL